MATLHVRNVPDDLYEALRRRAEESSRSISEETVELLHRAIRPERAKLKRFLREVQRSPLRVPPGTPSPAELIRQDRDSR